MFDIGIGEISITELFVIASVIVVFALQLFLCMKVKKLWFKLIPIIIFISFALILAYKSAYATGWDGLGYFILLLLDGILLLTCVVGWIIWFVVKYVKKKKAKSITDRI